MKSRYDKRIMIDTVTKKQKREELLKRREESIRVLLRLHIWKRKEKVQGKE